MRLGIAGAPLMLATAMLGSISAVAQTTQPAGAALPNAMPAEALKAAFVEPGFAVPTLVETPHFKLVPLGPALVKIDFDAYMSSVEHLQKTFTRSPDWPHAGISDADAMKDMDGEQLVSKPVRPSRIPF